MVRIVILLRICLNMHAPSHVSQLYVQCTEITSEEKRFHDQSLQCSVVRREHINKKRTNCSLSGRKEERALANGPTDVV